MSDASKFKDSEGTLVNVKDAQARADIATIYASLALKMVYKFTYSYTAQSVGANANKSFSADNSIPSGYTAIAIEYMNTGDYMFHARHVNIGTGAFSIHNNSNSAITTSPALTVTCVKNEMYGGSINPS